MISDSFLATLFFWFEAFGVIRSWYNAFCLIASLCKHEFGVVIGVIFSLWAGMGLCCLVFGPASARPKSDQPEKALTEIRLKEQHTWTEFKSQAVLKSYPKFFETGPNPSTRTEIIPKLYSD